MEELLLSQRLRNVQDALANYDHIRADRLDKLVEMAEAMEDKIRNLPDTKPSHPATSYYEGTLEDRTLSERNVYLCFKIYGPMDPVTLEETFDVVRHQHGWKKQSESGLRARQAKLKQLGILEPEPGPPKGWSPTGRRVPRHQVKRIL